MKADQLFNELKLLAEKLGTIVSEQNFRITGISVKSGYCKVKGKDLFLIDKHLKLLKKIEVLAEYLGQLPLNHIDVSDIEPDIRQCLIQHGASAAIFEQENRIPPQ